jgi:hypothetical protein
VHLEAAAKSMKGEELTTLGQSCRETYDLMARISIAPERVRCSAANRARL